MWLGLEAPSAVILPWGELRHSWIALPLRAGGSMRGGLVCGSWPSHALHEVAEAVAVLELPDHCAKPACRER
jgi:hypothetical protein